MLSDGDSAAYSAVCKAKPYGSTNIEKLECINHAPKRMGTALRKVAKEYKLGGLGRGKLTDKKCELLQNYYRGAILNHSSNTQQMRTAIWASLYHSASCDSHPQHSCCPTGKESWCWYNKQIANDVEPDSHDLHPSKSFVNGSVLEKIAPVYRRMSEEALLRRMTHGGTQNANESFNALIWLRCPKNVFMGRQRVEAAVSRAVMDFNQGALGLIGTMNCLNIAVIRDTAERLRKRDEKRIETLQVTKRKRSTDDRDTTTYGAGQF